MRFLFMLALTLFLSGCFSPTLDTSSEDSRRESYNRILQTLSTEERNEFDALVIFYLQEYEVGGDVHQNEIETLNGMTFSEIQEITKKHKEYIDKIMTEEIASHDEYLRYKQDNPEKFATPDYFKVSSLVKPTDYGFDLKYVVIQSLADEIKVESVAVNRGNCSIFPHGGDLRNNPLPRLLKYGEILRIQLNYDCAIVETQIHSNLGPSIYSFNNH